ncbi:hypothetical protein HanRHA438_Chr03g0117961 [Helianthus annuus]|nr:hypothetical protein HanRHA438_Chr03g0117961 [Helianthus annuus]
MNYPIQTNTFTNINERTRPLFMFVHLTKRTVFVCLLNERTQTNFTPNSSRTVRPTFGSFTALTVRIQNLTLKDVFSLKGYRNRVCMYHAKNDIKSNSW